MKTSFFVGIDCSKDTFALALMSEINATPITASFSNTKTGFTRAITFLKKQKCVLDRTLICVEMVGVYADKLCHYLADTDLDLRLAIPQRVHQTITDTGHKTDVIDSIHIAKYAIRYTEDLKPFEPLSAPVQAISSLINLREVLKKQKTQLNNQMKAILQMKQPDQDLLDFYRQLIDDVKINMKTCESKIEAHVKLTPKFAQGTSILKSLPGVGPVTSWVMLVYTRGFTRIPSYRQAASHLGIAPREFRSGSSIHKPSRSRGYGPRQIRSVLYLSVTSLLKGKNWGHEYCIRKEGFKHKSIIINNLCNKQLKLILALLRTWKPYNEIHRSINPILLTKP